MKEVKQCLRQLVMTLNVFDALGWVDLYFPAPQAPVILRSSSICEMSVLIRQRVQIVHHADEPLIKNMGVNLRGGNIGMA